MVKLRQVLNDIVINAYKDDFKESYLRFFVEITGKTAKSQHGTYNIKTHKISIYNSWRDDESILCTTIHELAHHIDTCNRGDSDHQDAFYREFKRLLFTAMDMGVIHKEKFLDTAKDASDSNKIRKMMAEYTPNCIPYKSDAKTIFVYDCFEHKDALKALGYRFNGMSKAWEKEVSDTEEEKAKLSAFPGIRIEVHGAADFHFEGKIKLIATGDTYVIKDTLKALGFRYQEKKWIYYAKNMEEASRIQAKVPCKVK